MAKKKNKKKESVSQQLNVHPVIEAGVIVVKILVLVTAAIVFLISLMANAEWYEVAIRTSIAMMSIGLVGWFGNWILGKWVLSYELQKYEEEKRLEQEQELEDNLEFM